MTAIFNIVDNDKLSPEIKVERLKQINEELSNSLRKLAGFQTQLMSLQKCETSDQILDQMEILLDDAAEYTFLRLYLKDHHGELKLEREMCPQDIPLDWATVEWACQHQELAILPKEDQDDNSVPQSTLLLPLVGHSSIVGILVLWLDVLATTVTREESTLLTMLARETATVIETLQYRQRIDDATNIVREVVESVPHGLMAIDGNQTITVLNATMEFMLGIRRGDVVGQQLMKVLPQTAGSLIHQMVSSGEQDERELVIDLDGSEEILGLSFSPMGVNAHGERLGNVIICRDLKLSREVAKLRELDGMKNDFLSLVSHELRTPLTSIMAYSETLLMEGMVDTEEERREYIQIIHDEGGRLSRLINDVLDLTKLEAGKMDYHYDQLQIQQVVGTALASSSSLSDKKDIEVLTEMADDLPPARIDSDRLMQVFMNLLSNAIKFTPEGGTITIRASLADPFEEQLVKTLLVSVTDTGIGIAPENLNRVFSKFEQIENIDHHSVGTGLGMPICKQIVEEGHSGIIWIESEVGVGTTIYFRIPLS